MPFGAGTDLGGPTNYVLDAWPVEQGVALTGHNRTGPPCSVDRPTADAPGGRPARLPAALPTPTNDADRRQTIDASEQNNTGSSQSSMQLRDWFSVWNLATILQTRLSAFTGCGFHSRSITSSLSWRTKCYLDVHQVTSGHLSASPMCVVVEHSAPPAQTASWCRQLRPPPSRSLPH